MRIIKAFLAVFIILSVVSCKKSQTEVSLAGKWNITSAVGNDDRHWTGSFTLKLEGGTYTGRFLWDATDGQSTGTDDVTGTYNSDTKVLTMHSKVITGNIEAVVYTVNVTDNGTKMHGTWTGSSDGSVEDPGVWSAEKE